MSNFASICISILNDKRVGSCYVVPLDYIDNQYKYNYVFYAKKAGKDTKFNCYDSYDIYIKEEKLGINLKLEDFYKKLKDQVVPATIDLGE